MEVVRGRTVSRCQPQTGAEHPALARAAPAVREPGWIRRRERGAGSGRERMRPGTVVVCSGVGCSMGSGVACGAVEPSRLFPAIHQDIDQRVRRAPARWCIPCASITRDEDAATVDPWGKAAARSAGIAPSAVLELPSSHAASSSVVAYGFNAGLRQVRFTLAYVASSALPSRPYRSRASLIIGLWPLDTWNF